MREQILKSSRRNFLTGASCIAIAATGCARKPAEQEAPAKATLNLSDFQPKSMLVVPESKIERAKFPAIDFHSHVYMYPSLTGKDVGANPVQIPADQVDQIVKWMDEMNVQIIVNSTGGNDENLRRTVRELVGRYPGRFLTFTEPAWERIAEPDYPKWQADEIGRAKEAGAVGIKILKILGVYLREKVTEGRLLPVDDPRFDPMWETAGALGMPVVIHTADPDAFFTPVDRFNERWEELSNHPDWAFYGKDCPSKPELLAARNRVVARHPKTIFVGYHVANHPENLAEVGEWLDTYPNLHVDTGARLGEIGRQPRTARKFFDKYQDRILFGTDATPNADAYPQQDLKPEMYHCYFRFFETEDEYFNYSPAPIPPQGRWRIYGIGLPDSILKKVYHNNAARLLKLQPV
jgi:predicted TIM-barrel fold metal-dependent hydrolase